MEASGRLVWDEHLESDAFHICCFGSLDYSEIPMASLFNLLFGIWNFDVALLILLADVCLGSVALHRNWGCIFYMVRPSGLAIVYRLWFRR